jgi:hypothetical protein
MGLDMYLTKKTYIGSEYEHRKVKAEINISIDGKPIPINPKRISYIEERVGYWRKANQIHSWFVKNIQDGNDDCGEYSLPKEKAVELLNICKEIKSESKLKDGAITNGYTFENGVKMPIVEDGKEIANPEVAERLLPTTSGFFFGSNDYDEYYMQDIDDTIQILETILNESDQSKEYFTESIYYQSSW